MTHPDVSRAVAFGLPHAEKGEIPAAGIELHPDSKASESDLLTWYRQNLSPLRHHAASGFSNQAACRGTTMARCCGTNYAGDILKRFTDRRAERRLTYGNKCFLRRRHRHLPDRVDHQLGFIEMNPVPTCGRNHLLHVISNLPQTAF